MTTAIIKKKKTQPDPILVKDQLACLQAQRRAWGAEKYSAYMVWILGKRETKRAAKTHSRVMPFVWNAIQRDVFEKRGKRNIALKPRQVGLTTWFLLERLFVPSTLEPGTNGLLISQTGGDATKHFAMLRRAYKYYGATDPGNPALNSLTASLHENLLHTSYSNRKELIFDQLDNTISIASAEVEEAGQGVTLSRVVCSEVARWPGNPEETLANLKEAVIMEGTIDLESTANGAGGYFFEEYQRADSKQSDFVAHFHPWWWQQEYRVELTDVQRLEMELDLQEDERKLQEKFRLDLEQIAFRREKKISLRHNFEEKYPEDAVTAFLISGFGFFDKEVLRARMLELANFKPYSSFSNKTTVILHNRIKGRKYVIGADAASGKAVGSELDASSAKVLDLETGEEVACFNEQLPPEDFAYALMDLGRYYNDALIGIERSTGAEAGGDGGTVNMVMIANGYPNIYHHREFIRRRAKSKPNDPKVIDAYPGFPTTGGTRPIILNKLQWMVSNYPELIWDMTFVKQALMFTRNERGRPEATIGAHDDAVLATAIAHGIRMIELGLWDPLTVRSQRYGATPVSEQAAEEEQ